MIKTFHIYAFIAFFLTSISGISQEEDSIAKPEKTRNYLIEGGFSGNYGSTNLNNEFIQKLLFGGRIDDNLKDLTLDRTNKRNRFGLEINYEMKFVDLKDTLFQNLPDWNYYIGFGSYNNVSASYTRDFFSLAFYGNKQFENETAQLGKSDFTSYKFEKITFGLMSRDFSTSIGVSLIIGDRLNKYDFKQLDMFTHPEGTDITMEYDGKIKLSNDRNNSSFMAFNGTGLGIDFSTLLYNRKYTLSVTNLGFVVWARNTSYSNTQTTYNFDGIEIDNIFRTTSEELRTKALDILPELENKTFTTLLPTIFRVDKNFDKEKQLQSIYGIRYKLVSNYLPSVYAGGSYQMSPKLRFSGSLAWGGYAGLRANLGAYFNHKNFFGGIETTNAVGLISRKGNGNGANLFFMTYF